MVKEIKLTQGQLAIVDDEDYEYLSQFKWYAKDNNTTYYARRFDDQIGTIYMHREILNLTDGMHVDHINHDGLDNRKCNLRLCTKKQNSYNVVNRRSVMATSKYRGVWTTLYDKWIAYIFIDGVRICLGVFDKEEDAALAYNDAAASARGDFAILNNVQKK